MTTEITTTGMVDQLASNASAEDVTSIFKELRALKAACRRADSHSRAIVLIQACIDNGINTRARIRGTLPQLGFDADHAIIVLKACTGKYPDVHHWYRDDNGVFHNHLDAQLTAAA